MRYSTVLILVLLSTATLCAQGQGSPGSNGIVPRISFEHREAGVPNTIRWHGFAPNRPLSLFVSHGEAPTPLAPQGLGPAVLGPDLNSVLGAVTLTGLDSNSSGEFIAPTVIPLALAGIPFHFQAAASDFGAPFGGFAFSEHRRIRFGYEPDARVFALALPDGSRRLLEIFGDARLASPPDVRLEGLNLRPINLINREQGAFGHRERAAVDEFAWGGPLARLPGGFRLLLSRSTSNDESVILIHPDAHMDVLATAFAPESEFMFEADLAVSDFDPYAVIPSEPGLAEYGGAKALILRTDGWNIPGQSGKAMELPLPAGADIDFESFTFLDGALYVTSNDVDLLRFDLSTLTTTVVPFPVSGGLTPTYIDSNAAVSGDGSTLAIGAGQSTLVHDIYLVTAAGVATNLSQAPGAYRRANPGDPGGAEMALDETGAFIAFNRIEGANETYMRSTAAAAPEALVTDEFEFVESIDTVVGVGFRTGGRLILGAGLETNQLELYSAVINSGGPNQTTIENLSLTSGVTTAPFGLGSDLDYRRRFETQNHLVTEFVDSTGAGSLVFVSNSGHALVRNFDLLMALAPRQSETLLARRAISGVIDVELILQEPVPSAANLWTSTGMSLVKARAEQVLRNENALVIDDANGRHLLLIDGQGTLQVFAGPAGDEITGLWIDRQGKITAIVEDATAGSTRLRRFDRSSGLWTTTAGPIGAVGIGTVID